VFEAERSDERVMREPPRRREELLFGPGEVALSLAQGGGFLLALLGFYVLALDVAPETAARGAVFVALALGNLALALSDSIASGGLFAAHRRIYWIIVAAICGALGAVFFVPPLRSMFGVVAPPPFLLGWALALAAVSGAWAFAVKRGGAWLRAERRLGEMGANQ
jgi:Ca2+-transporting ATPase